MNLYQLTFGHLTFSNELSKVTVKQSAQQTKHFISDILINQNRKFV